MSLFSSLTLDRANFHLFSKLILWWNPSKNCQPFELDFHSENQWSVNLFQNSVNDTISFARMISNYHDICQKKGFSNNECSKQSHEFMIWFLKNVVKNVQIKSHESKRNVDAPSEIVLVHRTTRVWVTQCTLVQNEIVSFINYVFTFLSLIGLA